MTVSWHANFVLKNVLRVLNPVITDLRCKTASSSVKDVSTLAEIV